MLKECYPFYIANRPEQPNSDLEVLDKYTVYFYDGTCLTLSSNPDSPQGVSQWSEYFGVNDSDFETGKVGNDKMINWFELPSVIQAHIEKRVGEK